MRILTCCLTLKLLITTYQWNNAFLRKSWRYQNLCTRPTPSLAYCTATIFSVKGARAARCPAPDAPAVFTAYFGAIQCHTKRNWAPGSRPHIGHHNKTRYNSTVQLAVSGTARNEIGPLAAGRILDTTTKHSVAVSGVQHLGDRPRTFTTRFTLYGRTANENCKQKSASISQPSWS